MKFIFFLLSVLTVSATSAQKPNLLIIHTDEHSFRTLSCYRELMDEDQAYVWGRGAGVETTNIDRLAREGAICMNYYASSPVCTPSRASLITGLQRQATGAWKNGEFLREDIITFAHILKDEGYATSYVGKWHLAGHSKYTFDVEYNAGFDDNRYMMNGGHAPYFHITDEGMEGIGEKKATGFPEDELVHLTDFFTDRTLEILERDKDKAFCLMLSIPDPHTPDYARPPYHTMYDDMDVSPPKTMGQEYTDKKPAWALAERNEAREFDAGALRQYFGMVKHIDDKVGQILAFLDKNALTDNTIIVFTADHGDMFFEHKRRNKGVPYEASARIPYVVRYPKKIPAGKVIRTAYSNVDFVPTILDLMDVRTEVEFHGMNTAVDFTSPVKEVECKRIIYYAEANGSWVAAVNNRYKLIVSKVEGPWLFDLEKDPDEVLNFYNEAKYKKVSRTMMKELIRQLEEYREPAYYSGKDLIFSSNTYPLKAQGSKSEEVPVADKKTFARSIDGKYISWKEHIIDDTALSNGSISGSDGLVMADLDLDGFEDIISVHESDTKYDGLPRGSIRIAFGSANPDKWELITLAEGAEAGGAEDVAVGDINGDGYLDVIAACELAHLIYFENPRFNIRSTLWKRIIPKITQNRGSFIRVFTSDLNNDNQLEIIAANKGSQSGYSRGAVPKPISYFEIIGNPLLDSAWIEHELIRVLVPINSQPIDIDSDGDIDIIAGSRGEKRIILLENTEDGSNRFLSHDIEISGNPEAQVSGFNMDFVDLNDDGLLDIVSSGAKDMLWLEHPSDFSESWRSHYIGTLEPDEHTGFIGVDINGDGYTDIMIGGYSRGKRENDGDVNINGSLGRLAWFENPKDLSHPWIRHDISRRKRGMFDKFIARDLDGDGDMDFISTRGNSYPYDGVFWLEQIRTEEPEVSFTKARDMDSEEMPLPVPEF